MRPLAVLLEFSFLVLFSSKSDPDHGKNKLSSVAYTQGKSKQRQQLKWWAGRARAGLAGMVVGALLQFIKRVFILVIGLIRLSYRKVCYWLLALVFVQLFELIVEVLRPVVFQLMSIILFTFTAIINNELWANKMLVKITLLCTVQLNV